MLLLEVAKESGHAAEESSACRVHGRELVLDALGLEGGDGRAESLELLLFLKSELYNLY